MRFFPLWFIIYVYSIFFVGVDFREKTLEIDGEIFKVCVQMKTRFPN